MLPEDIQDLFVGIVLLIGFIIIMAIFSPLSFNETDEFIYENLELRDEEELFFLNLLRTNVEDKTIADLIILNENQDLIDEINDEIKKILSFYGKANYEYGLLIKYPGKEKVVLGCNYEIEEKGIKQILPSLNNNIIELYFKFQGGECIEYWL